MSDKKQIYVIGPSGGPLKIGIADNAKSRRSILNVGNHQYLRVHYIYEAESEEEALRLEKELHYHFQDNHIRGEWFQLSDSDQVKQMFGSLIMFHDFAPDGWSLKRKGCDEFTAEVCRTARSGLGLSIKELAEKANIGAQSIENFESGKSTPSIDTLESIKNAFEDYGVEFIREQAGKKLRVLI